MGAVFNAYRKPLRAKLLALRRLILDTARTTAGVGAIEETLKWGQPSYLTTATKSGSTVRIDRVKSAANRYAVFFHCQTDLVATFRDLSQAVPGTELRRQPLYPVGRESGYSGSGAAPLRGAGADLSSEETQGGTDK